MKDYPLIRRELLKCIGELRDGIADPMKAFAAVGEATYKPGALDTKTKELMALAIAIAARCDGCIAFHSRVAHNQGATRQEVLETIAVAIQMGGGPSMVYGAEAIRAFDQFSGGPCADK